MKNPKNSRALNFREIRAFANLRENKVLAKIKCYTVYGNCSCVINAELMMVFVWIWSCHPICDAMGHFRECVRECPQYPRLLEYKSFCSLILTYKSGRVCPAWMTSYDPKWKHPSWIRFPGTESWQNFLFLNMMYIVPQKFLSVRSVYWKDTSRVKMNSWGKCTCTSLLNKALIYTILPPQNFSATWFDPCKSTTSNR